jgi:hypothetical protein
MKAAGKKKQVDEGMRRHQALIKLVNENSVFKP